MRTLIFLLLLSIQTRYLLAQSQICQNGKLDARVALALKTTLKELPASPTASVEQIRDVQLPVLPFPRSDVQILTITADNIPIHVYNPTHSKDLPILIYYHPGGFVTPFLPFMQYDCWRQAKAYRALVIAVDYRVAPEHKFPAAVNDAFHAFQWVITHAQTIGGDTSRIMVMGLSAGGNLAAVVCQKAQQAGLGHKIKLQVLHCPSTDHPQHSARYPSYQQYASGYFLTKAFCLYSIQTYAPGIDTYHPEVAPIQRQSLSGLPPVLMLTAEFDPFRDEGYAYYERLRQAGVPGWYHCFSGQIHCLLGLPANAKQLQQVDELIVKAMGSVWGHKR
ncbi:alpha/beta hydrolase [Spirosoma sp. KNUC1025]|uniref:alpha/beta hydrolase n=1 Tax=Spirosoma sp. KNUC1025 TaxID=2894082 RepID=UPI00386E4149|nr:alpha/beta hydrolase [Spirosoma sp. KNUC1025]